MNLLFLLHQTICGAIAAAGFGVLFNIGFRSLPWCAASGAVALAVRTYCLGLGWNLEASSFAAALVVSFFVLILRAKTDISQNALDVVGCIPMVPGSFAALLRLTWIGCKRNWGKSFGSSNLASTREISRFTPTSSAIW